ncbi:MAG: GNAT family N-acetyltransferase [Candidatus Aenigmatarchaeota archaeon]
MEGEKDNFWEKIDLVQITKKYLLKNLDSFFALERNWTVLGEDAWNRENFLMELPLKWRLSFAAEADGKIIGYLIGSKFDEKTSRVNKILVDSKHRKMGVGRKLMERYFEACRREGIERLELKALVENAAANRLYVGLGYKKAGLAEGDDGRVRLVYEKIP